MMHSWIEQLYFVGKKQHFERFLFLQNNRVFSSISFLCFLCENKYWTLKWQKVYTHTPWMFWPQKLIETGIRVMGIDQLLHFFPNMILNSTKLLYFIFDIFDSTKKRNYNIFLNIWHNRVRFLNRVKIWFWKKHTFINCTLLIM
jgi:hypothetical protein